VFTDVVMPGMTALSWRRRSAAIMPTCQSLLTSGNSHALSESGSDGFEVLQKPYSMEQLSRVLHSVARWRRMKRATASAGVLISAFPQAEPAGNLLIFFALSGHGQNQCAVRYKVRKAQTFREKSPLPRSNHRQKSRRSSSRCGRRRSR